MLWFYARVYNENHDPETFTEREKCKFCSDLPKASITKEMMDEIVEIYYAKKDYPDLIEVLSAKPTLLNSDHNIMKMQLFDVICGKRYHSPYFQPYADLIEGFDPNDPKHKNACARIMLQFGYKSLVNDRRIERRLLTDEYMEDYFTDRNGVAIYTIERVLEFVKHLKRASIYIFDQTGDVLIASHKARKHDEDAELKINSHTSSIVCLIGDHHVEQITDANMKRS